MKYKVLLMKLVQILGITGALNWVLVGLLKFDLVVYLFGYGLLTDVVYLVAGLSGVFVIGKLLFKK